MKLDEKLTVASASDIARFRPRIEEIAELLIDELADVHPEIREDASRIENTKRALTKKISLVLIGMFGSMYGRAPMDEETSLEKEDSVLIERLNRLAGLK
ncbi:MAG: hypothetical protein CMA72_09750 [Euryarchaeota archaeon]|nr:hypothetical protein [Euryarchaeota archaeon]|tara:strand:+ start:7015 stop:7314 length:300 start_codon:yes stop_codon:yes gene_type:complete